MALLVGWGGAAVSFGGPLLAAHGWPYGVQTRRLIALSLEGTAVLPPSPPPQVVTPLAAKEFGVDPTLAAAGRTEFSGTCDVCHGRGVIAGGAAPDLRASGVVLSATAFVDVVRDGSRAASGMPRFRHLTDEQLLALRHFIRQRAESALATTAK